VLHHRERSGVASKEVLPDVGAALCFIGLIVTIGSAVHQVAQSPIRIGLQQGVPLATPDNFDDVPSGTPEEALELLDDFSVASDWPIESLQVAVNDKGQVVQVIVGGELQGTPALDLVHFSVTEESPDVLLAGVGDAAVVRRSG
jgi:hypothetical protein